MLQTVELTELIINDTINLILNFALFSLRVLQRITFLYNNIIDRFYNVHASDLLTSKSLKAFSTRSASLSLTLNTTRIL